MCEKVSIKGVHKQFDDYANEIGMSSEQRLKYLAMGIMGDLRALIDSKIQDDVLGLVCVLCEEIMSRGKEK